MNDLHAVDVKCLHGHLENRYRQGARRAQLPRGGICFQRLAVVLGRQRWPESTAHLEAGPNGFREVLEGLKKASYRSELAGTGVV